MALAVATEGEYALFQGEGNEVLVMAKALLPEGAVVLETLPGSALVGWEYEALFPYDGPFGEGDDGKRYLVVAGEHVSLTDGTGIVHTAPAYGEVDFDIACETP